MREGEGVRRSETGRDGDVELRLNWDTTDEALPSAQLRTGRHSFEWEVWNGQPPKSVGVVFSRRNAIKIPKSSMCSALWNMTYGTAKTGLADVLSPQNGLRLLLLEAQIPHKGGLWEYDTSMEVSSHNPQEALSPSSLLLVGCHHIHPSFRDRCL